MLRPAIRPLIVLSLVLSIAGTWAASARVHAGGLGPISTTLAYPVPPLLASAAAVLDANTGQWLRLYNADSQLPMASTTKIMTALLAIEHGHLQDMVKVSRAAATVGQSTMGLVQGEQLNMVDLLYGLLIPSGNDAAIAIAEHVGGSVPAFVAEMNARARQLGLTHTHYTNPYGFSDTADGDDPNHYTSARDLVTLARVAMKQPLFRKIVDTATYVVPKTSHNREHDLATVNFFIQWYPGADGVKPGWTTGAGDCQVLDVQRDGRHLIAAILHTANVYTDARDLLNFALGDFTWHPSGLAGDTPDQLVIAGTAHNPVWYFPSSGHEVAGPFLAYYKSHGGYSVAGAPQTETLELGGETTQFFANQVLTLDATTQVVLPEPLGFSALPGIGWLKRAAKVPNTTTQRYYPQTGHTVTNRFLTFYLSLGGPAALGYPISEKQEENGILVQYFEDGELIWHAQPDLYHGYVSVAPLGMRSLAGLGLMTGSNLPALHAPYALPTATAAPDATPTTIGNFATAPASTAATTSPAHGSSSPTPGSDVTIMGAASPTSSPPVPTTTATATPSAMPMPASTATAIAAASMSATPSASMPSPTMVATTRPSATASPTAVPGVDTPIAPVG